MTRLHSATLIVVLFIGLLAVLAIPSTVYAGGCPGDGTVFAVASGSLSVYKVDVSNGAAAPTTFAVAQPATIAHDPTDCDRVYYTEATSPYRLAYWDESRTSNFLIGQTGLAWALDGLAFTSDGTLYGLYSDRLYELDKTTGAATNLGNISGLSTLIQAADLAFEPADDSGFIVKNGQLYEFDLGGMAVTALPNPTFTAGLGGLAFAEDGELYAAEPDAPNPIPDGNIYRLDQMLGIATLIGNSAAGTLQIIDLGSAPPVPVAVGLRSVSTDTGVTAVALWLPIVALALGAVSWTVVTRRPRRR